MKIALLGPSLKWRLSRFKLVFTSAFVAALTATLLAVFCLPANADFKLELEAAMEYDSNVATDAADNNLSLIHI